jgi:hypothetical protein
MNAPNTPKSSTRVAPFTSARALSFSLPDKRPRRIPFLYRLGSSLWYGMPAHVFTLVAFGIFAGALPADLGEVNARGTVTVDGTVTSKTTTYNKSRNYTGTAIEVTYVVDGDTYVAKRWLGRDVILTYPEHPKVRIDPQKPRRADVEGTKRPLTAGLLWVFVFMMGFFLLISGVLTIAGQRRAVRLMKLLERGVLTFATPAGPGPQSAVYVVDDREHRLPLTGKGEPLVNTDERIPVIYAEKKPSDAIILEKAFLRPHIDEGGTLEATAWWQWPVCLGAYGFVVAIVGGIIARKLVATLL